MNRKAMIVANSDWLLYHFRLPLLRALQEEGLTLDLVCPQGKYWDDLTNEGYDLLPWHMERKSLSPLRVTRAVFDLIRYYRELQPDVVHHITIQPIFYGSIAARIAQVPVVINNFTGLGYLFSGSRRAFWLRHITLPILRWAGAGKQVFTVVLNEQDRVTLLEKKLITEDQSQVIPGEGVDLERFHPSRDQDISEDEVVVLMAARLLWDKGVSEFVNAAETISAMHDNVNFLLAGAPDPGNPTSISQSRIDHWQADSPVEFLGYREDMASILRKADIAVLPSYHEGIPVFLLEAAASGLPLVATDLEGCRMVIEQGENGFLVPKGDEEELSAAIIKLIDDPDMREKMGVRSRIIVEDHFDQSQIVEQFLNLYRRLGVLSD